MAKMCDELGCTYPVFSHKKCKSHQYRRRDTKYLQSLKVSKKKPVRVINKIATKRKSERSEYSILRSDFFEKPENKMCAVFPWLEATDIHHRWGTENGRLLMVKWWLAVSREGHKYIDDHPEEAYQKKWNLYRNQDPEKQ